MTENKFLINSIPKLTHISLEVKDHLKFMITHKLRVKVTFLIYKLLMTKLTPDSEMNVKRLKRCVSLKESSLIGKRKSKISLLNIILT